jgi:hypothetical protein
MTLSTTTLRHYAECRWAECHDLFYDLLSVNMLSVVKLNVVAPYHLFFIVVETRQK